MGIDDSVSSAASGAYLHTAVAVVNNCKGPFEKENLANIDHLILFHWAHLLHTAPAPRNCVSKYYKYCNCSVKILTFWLFNLWLKKRKEIRRNVFSVCVCFNDGKSDSKWLLTPSTTPNYIAHSQFIISITTGKFFLFLFVAFLEVCPIVELFFFAPSI